MLIKQNKLPVVLPILTGVSTRMQRIYAARGIEHAEQLDRQLNALLPFDTMMNIEKASKRLAQALQLQQRILIIGDFDADGATSSALAVTALRAMGAENVDFLVPNRFSFGYGLTPGIVDVAKSSKPQLIVTVDNGIASIDGVLAANKSGIDVLITDHHLPGDFLPEACAIVNPNQAGDAFPSKCMAGVGVIFYVMLALRRHLIGSGWFDTLKIPPPNMAQFLDLVALGTIADVVPLDKNNRILVHQGLLRIRKGLARPGIAALLEIAGKSIPSIRASDFGFAIAPRLNAAGRLDDMSLGIDCLLCDDLAKARSLAIKLDCLNVERRKIESTMSEQAIFALNTLTHRLAQTGNKLPVALCLLDESWHQGVIGILAGRLKERYHRPVIAFARVSTDELKGSARSVPGLNIRDVLAVIDRDHPGLMIKFGGHAMAAGLSLRPQSFDAFEQAFVLRVSALLDQELCTGVLYSDGSIDPSDMGLPLALELQDAGPWGQQFPEPVFDDRFEVLDQRIVGKNHLKLTLALDKTYDTLDAIAFNVDLKNWPNHRVKFIRAAYKLDINQYQGRTKLQLLMQSLEAEVEN